MTAHFVQSECMDQMLDQELVHFYLVCQNFVLQNASNYIFKNKLYKPSAENSLKIKE